MSDQPNETIDDAVLTKTKKPRSEAQKAATERMRTALEAKQSSSSKITPEEKKLRLQAIKEQLNGPRKEKTPVKEESDASSEEEEILPPPPVAPKPKKKDVKIVPKKEPKVVYETESESEEEVIVVKKKKKPKKKTIIYEEESDASVDEEPITKRSVPLEPVRKERETKTQQNAASKFKVTPGHVAPPKSIYYFAD